MTGSIFLPLNDRQQSTPTSRGQPLGEEPPKHISFNWTKLAVLNTRKIQTTIFHRSFNPPNWTSAFFISDNHLTKCLETYLYQYNNFVAFSRPRYWIGTRNNTHSWLCLLHNNALMRDNHTSYNSHTLTEVTKSSCNLEFQVWRNNVFFFSFCYCDCNWFIGIDQP